MRVCLLNAVMHIVYTFYSMCMYMCACVHSFCSKLNFGNNVNKEASSVMRVLWCRSSPPMLNVFLVDSVSAECNIPYIRIVKLISKEPPSRRSMTRLTLIQTSIVKGSILYFGHH